MTFLTTEGCRLGLHVSTVKSSEDVHSSLSKLSQNGGDADRWARGAEFRPVLFSGTVIS